MSAEAPRRSWMRCAIGARRTLQPSTSRAPRSRTRLPDSVHARRPSHGSRQTSRVQTFRNVPTTYGTIAPCITFSRAPRSAVRMRLSRRTHSGRAARRSLRPSPRRDPRVAVDSTWFATIPSSSRASSATSFCWIAAAMICTERRAESRRRSRTRCCVAGKARSPRLFLGQQPQAFGKAHVVCAMCDAELLVHALLVRVDRFLAERLSIADLRSGVAALDEHEHVPLSFGEAVEAGALLAGGILRHESAGEHAAGVLLHVHLAAHHGADRIHEVSICRALHEIPRRAGLERGHQVLLL